jgi:hypothetical protein
VKACFTCADSGCPGHLVCGILSVEHQEEVTTPSNRSLKAGGVNTKMGEASLALTISEEDVLRANVYRLLAHALRAGPARTDLDAYAA